MTDKRNNKLAALAFCIGFFATPAFVWLAGYDNWWERSVDNATLVLLSVILGLAFMCFVLDRKAFND